MADDRGNSIENPPVRYWVWGGALVATGSVGLNLTAVALGYASGEDRGQAAARLELMSGRQFQGSRACRSRLS